MTTSTLLLALVACKKKEPAERDSAVDTGDPPAEPLTFFIDDWALRDEIRASAVHVSGAVFLPDGMPVEGATVAVGEASSTTGKDGTFTVEVPSRDNRWVTINGAGIRTTLTGARLSGPATEKSIDLGRIEVVPTSSAVRLLFAGDTSFGRRFLDPDETTDRWHMPEDDPDALIQVSDPGPGAIDAVSRMVPLFQAVDFPVVNFESPVTTDTSTPHPSKDYCYFSLPDSLAALGTLGVSYASLGNNHVYDYQDQGVIDTIEAFEDWNLDHSGAGLTPEEAFTPFRRDVGSLPLSFISASTVSGSQHEIHYSASETQGGSADANDTERLEAVIAGERAKGQLPVVQLHTGVEYSKEPSEYTREILDLAAQSGAHVVIAHHPHVGQGFGVHDDVLQVWSLGNFTFDQDRHETMLGMVIVLDLDHERERALAAYPIYIEDYRPRLATGETALMLLHRVAELSSSTVDVVVDGGRLLVARTGERAVSAVDRTLEIPVAIGPEGMGVLDLRGVTGAGESLLRVDQAPGATRLVAGRDILVYGSLEDEDIDEDFGEVSRFDVTSEYSDVCVTWARRGLQGLCMHRASTNTSDTVVPFRNRVRVWGDAENTPNKDVSLVGYVMGEGAGPTSVEVEYSASEGDAEFGQDVVWTRSAGTFPWEPLAVDLDIPDDVSAEDAPFDNPRALRFFARHSPPAQDEGIAAFDDFAFVTWHDEVDLGADAPRVPHGRQFVRVEGEPGAVVTVTVTLRKTSF